MRRDGVFRRKTSGSARLKGVSGKVNEEEVVFLRAFEERGDLAAKVRLRRSRFGVALRFKNDDVFRLEFEIQELVANRFDVGDGVLDVGELLIIVNADQKGAFDAFFRGRRFRIGGFGVVGVRFLRFFLFRALAFDVFLIGGAQLGQRKVERSAVHFDANLFGGVVFFKEKFADEFLSILRQDRLAFGVAPFASVLRDRDRDERRRERRRQNDEQEKRGAADGAATREGGKVKRMANPRI